MPSLRKNTAHKQNSDLRDDPLLARDEAWHLNEEAPSGADRRLDHLQENCLMGEAKTKRRLALG